MAPPDPISTKTKFLNSIRRLGMFRPVEDVLVGLALNKTVGSVFARIAPNNYQYPRSTIRTCERNGIRYSLDISDYMQYCIYFGIEIEPRDTLYGLVKDGTTVIDVGTNIGETLLNFARLNRTGSNIGFEPVPYLYERAKTNIDLNSFRNIRLINKGLSSREEILSFQEAGENNSGGIFLTRTDDTSAGRAVEVMRLDDFVHQNLIEDISLIKIDVEGFEMEVLKGAAEVIEEFRPTLFLEIDDKFLARQESSFEAIFEFLTERRYKIIRAQTGEEVRSGAAANDEHFDIIGLPVATA